jgi:serine protease Do
MPSETLLERTKMLKRTLRLLALVMVPLAVGVGVRSALPAGEASATVIAKGRQEPTRGSLGITVSETLTSSEAASLGLPSAIGAVITVVRRGGAGEKAGLKVEDTILEFGGKVIQDAKDLATQISSARPGASVPVVLLRARLRKTLQVEIGSPLPPLQPEMPRTPVVGEPRTGDTGFGIYFRPSGSTAPSDDAAPIVAELWSGGAGFAARMAAGDRILRFNGTETTTIKQVESLLKDVPAGGSARVVFVRPGEKGETEQLAFLRRK